MEPGWCSCSPKGKRPVEEAFSTVVKVRGQELTRLLERGVDVIRSPNSQLRRAKMVFAAPASICGAGSS